MDEEREEGDSRTRLTDSDLERRGLADEELAAEEDPLATFPRLAGGASVRLCISRFFMITSDLD